MPIETEKKKPGKDEKQKSAFRALLRYSVLVLGILAFRSSVAAPYTVPTGSMEPTIRPGDRILVNKTAYGIRMPFTGSTLAEFAAPKRGDVVLIENPVGGSIPFVKRLVGLPGDVVSLRDGFLSINGKPVAPGIPGGVSRETWIKRGGLLPERLSGKRYQVQRLAHAFRSGDGGTFTVPEGHYFFLGDNRDRSNDSRYWGVLPPEKIIGRAEAVLFSTNHLSRVGLRL